MKPHHSPKKSLGQHWLFDEAALTAICDAAEITAQDTVLEIGPGLGPLTKKLVAKAKQVIAVELDDTLAAQLPGRINASNLTVIHQDILQFDLSQLPDGYKVVANVPYYVTSLIVRYLLESPTPPLRSVLLVQKEVAQRLAATPGDMSVLAVAAQLYAMVSLGPVVPAELFDPAPKVDSQVVIFQRHPTPLFPDMNTKLFFRVVKAGFGEKRKTLRNSLSGGLHVSKDEVERILHRANIQPSTRAEALALADWYKLVKEIEILA